jgi:bifunctional non-homologous end joining protein LigD
LLHFIRPGNPTTAKTIPAAGGWLHEPKLDGYRLQIVKEGRTVRLFSRRGVEWSSRFPGLAEALLPVRVSIAGPRIADGIVAPRKSAALCQKRVQAGAIKCVEE